MPPRPLSYRRCTGKLTIFSGGGPTSPLLDFKLLTFGDAIDVINQMLDCNSSHEKLADDVDSSELDGSKNFANESGLSSSVVVRMSSFMVYLTDRNNSPSPIKAERLHIHPVHL